MTVGGNAQQTIILDTLFEQDACDGNVAPIFGGLFKNIYEQSRYQFLMFEKNVPAVENILAVPEFST